METSGNIENINKRIMTIESLVIRVFDSCHVEEIIMAYEYFRLPY